MLLIAAIFYQGFNKRTYKKIYGQTNIGENTGYSEEDYLKEVDNYKDYLFKSNDLALTNDNRYTENEILHMEDVRDIFKGAAQQEVPKETSVEIPKDENDETNA